MKLPNAENAFIEIAKLLDYVLNIDHPVGKHKAKVFNAALEMDASNAPDLIFLILEAIPEVECEPGLSDEYGNRYIADISIKWKNKNAIVRTAWIIHQDENFPRLVSCYIIKL